MMTATGKLGFPRDTTFRGGSDPKGFIVLAAIPRRGFMRTLVEYQQFQKPNGERFWEDDDGWYLDPDDPRVVELDAVKARFAKP